MPQNEPTYRFDDFRLDVANRQLWRGDERLDLSARYFDALVLLVREHGQLVEKDRFFEEVWEDVVVSDSALTQCIKDIRKTLGDNAARPQYIKTVPGYGYRFIETVEPLPSGDSPSGSLPSEDVPASQAESGADTSSEDNTNPSWRTTLLQGLAGTLGGGVAGMLGGLLYGFGLAYTPADPGMGTASILVVLISLCLFVGLAGGLGVSTGLMAADFSARYKAEWTLPGGRIIGAALGGMLVGGLTKLLGVDAFTLLFGRAPAGITGGPEGAVLGAALAIGAQLGDGLDSPSRWPPIVGAGLTSAAAGVLIPLAGGHLMAGSLDLLARSFTESRLQIDALGRFVGEVHFSHTTELVLGGIEGLLFGSCVVGFLVLARHALDRR